jgi:hypothetical protein
MARPLERPGPQDELAALADELWPTKDAPCE